MTGVQEEPLAIICRLGELLDRRGMTLMELSRRVGVTIVNLSVLKNNRARAIRFSTLQAICRELDCEVGELLVYQPRLETEIDEPNEDESR